MLRRNESARQRWGGHHQSLDHWLEERQEMLVQYCRMAGLPPYKSADGLPSTTDIKAFCEVLVDYVSTGHFEIYEHLLTQADVQSETARATAVQVYPLITVTTERVLNFNDKYAEVNENDPLREFDNDLSALGEALEVRMELEDRLLHALEEQAVFA
ncbi:sigma D regulator [Aliidiomarina soli]|uniref:Sigma D regulator n=1 Tax=Aliidiomarina soli TaxID=1928574 RepID=A0A432WFL2_9GAMM|nr:sigma D regulator [Aliidiomarina soli]RUO32596.1 sigma D regulator [Aliidiomarina soli]